ncbi:PE family protein [Mycobacterium sp. UM_CSW]|uniref:PE family protein n=1 Tax=Mycobacterium sp. UM_CSW TaxID=1370119 RepID=UPI00041B8186|nr:PE family protein [Mycobacterium sp. UM_CSW]
MSQVMVTPEALHTAAANLANIGLNVEAAHKVAAAPTTAIVPAAADEVSGAIAKVFSHHAANYQALAGQAAAFNDQFVQHLTAGAFSYTDIEAALASFLQNLQELPAEASGLVSAIAADPQVLATFLFLGFVGPPFVLFVAFWLAAIVSLIILLQLSQQFAPLLAAFGI